MLDAQWITCPWCGEGFEAVLDGSAGDADYTEDCPVCCRPILMHLRVDDEAGAQLWSERERQGAQGRACRVDGADLHCAPLQVLGKPVKIRHCPRNGKQV